MSIETGLVIAFAIVGLGGAGMAAVLIWLKKREADKQDKLHCA